MTRPEPGAGETAQRLIEHGFAPLVLPLTRIVPMPVGDLGDLQRFDAVTITSVNAIRHTPREVIAALTGRPVFAVGEVSAKAARDAGFANVHAAAGTAADLAPLMAAMLPPSSRVLHLAAVERTAGFAEQLAEAGLVLEVVDVYRAEKLSYPTDFLKTVFDQGPIWGAMSLSERAGEFLAELAAKPETAQAFESTTFFCISEKVARALRAGLQQKIMVSDAPSEDSVVRLLLSHR